MSLYCKVSTLLLLNRLRRIKAPGLFINNKDILVSISVDLKVNVMFNVF